MDEHIRVVLWGGFGLGILFGVLGQRLEFCVSGGLREWYQDRHPRRFAAILLALAFALLGTQFLVTRELIALQDSLYGQPAFSWLLVPLGGIFFGYGMMLARGCGSRALVLLGDGNLRSLVVLLSLAVGAGIVLTGFLASLRLDLIDKTLLSLPLAEPTLPGFLHEKGLPQFLARWLPTLLFVGALSYFSLRPMGLIKHPWQVAGAASIGLLVPLGWLLTGHFGADDFDPVQVESLTFVAPLTNGLQYLMLSSGTAATFGVTVVGGVLLGSLIASLASRDFELRAFTSPKQMLHSIGGGLLMGLGGALALGCSIGQGLTGLSTLAIMSFPAAFGILLGGLIAMKGPLAVREPSPSPRLNPAS